MCFGLDITAEVNNFEDLVSRLSPVCHVVDKYVSNLSVEDFTTKYLEKLQWTGMAEVNRWYLNIIVVDYFQTNNNKKFTYECDVTLMLQLKNETQYDLFDSYIVINPTMLGLQKATYLREGNKTHYCSWKSF